MIRRAGPRLDPVSAAGRLRGRPGRFLLHSASDDDGCGRWSFVGADPVRVVRGHVDPDGRCLVDGVPVDPFAAVAALAHGPPPDDDGPWPTAIGWLGYDLGRTIEKLAPPRVEPERVPDLWFGAYDAVWRHDGRDGSSAILARHAEAAERLIAALEAPAPPVAPAPRLGPLVPDHPDEDHLAAIRRILAYIRAGDVYQVNLARRLSARVIVSGDPLALHARLAPAPFGALLEADEVSLISNSPELFLRRRAGEGRVETRPIKGTRARAVDPAEDRARAAELLADAKERAEHLMIVDLLRNDLGRVAELGSVTVDDFCRAVAFPSVHHLVTTISARAGDTAALLRACFPGGSVTGAPKVRAMQIIDELEPVARGPYTGALGWLGPGGAVDLAIVIRTAVLDARRLRLSVGGGIVADSDPLRELEETEEKAAAWRRALID